MNLSRAIAIAADAHGGVFDKAGAPYILHPLRVMLSQSTDEARIVGVLHDVVEDCKRWTFELLESEKFQPSVIEALRLVTKTEGENHDSWEHYKAFIRRAASNPISLAVKLADIKDNLDESRLKQITQRDVERLQKYKRALAFLQGEDV